jgi:hypothetical protein
MTFRVGDKVCTKVGTVHSVSEHEINFGEPGMWGATTRPAALELVERPGPKLGSLWTSDNRVYVYLRGNSAAGRHKLWDVEADCFVLIYDEYFGANFTELPPV